MPRTKVSGTMRREEASEAGPPPMRQPGTRKPTRRKQLGLSVGDYDRLLAAQGGGCAICGNPPKTRRLDVDHDHKTGRVRGLLCHRCNRALPNWVTPRWLSTAAIYLAHGYNGVAVARVGLTIGRND